jgi:hypothetical protein
VSSYLAATNASPPSPSPAINGGGIVVRSLCRIAASERCLRRYSVSFRGESESEWPSSVADKLAVTTTSSKADEDDELKGQCHQNCNLIQRKASEINSLLSVYMIICFVFFCFINEKLKYNFALLFRNHRYFSLLFS